MMTVERAKLIAEQYVEGLISFTELMQQFLFEETRREVLIAEQRMRDRHDDKS